MRQLTCTAPGRLEWRDVAVPELSGGRDDALIRPLAVARCEIDPMLINAGPTAPDGFAVGHEAVAEVIAVGPGVSSVAVGQLVFSSFQLCCGRCQACADGRTANCAQYPVLSDYGMQPLSGVEYGGMLSDLVHVPYADAMLVGVPAGLDAIRLASVADNVCDGYRAVASHLAARPGADVLVVCHGAPSIAIYAAQAALAVGAGTVTFESDDTSILAVAESVGAIGVLTSFDRRRGRWPIVVDCGQQPVVLQHAIASTEPDGVLHSVSYYAAPREIGLALGKLYTWGIQFHIGRVNSAAVLPEVAELIGKGRLDPAIVTSDVIAWDHAADRYLYPALKLVVARLLQFLCRERNPMLTPSISELTKVRGSRSIGHVGRDSGQQARNRGSRSRARRRGQRDVLTTALGMAVPPPDLRGQAGGLEGVPQDVHAAVEVQDDMAGFDSAGGDLGGGDAAQRGCGHGHAGGQRLRRYQLPEQPPQLADVDVGGEG